MSMTRDDVLRELELLPVWQLRAPVQHVVTQKMAAEIKPETFAVVVQAEVVQKTEAEFEYYVAENNTCIFICSADRMDTALQSMLFDNILIALQIKAKKSAINLSNCNANLLIAMGEKTAQALLDSPESMEQLRNKTHALHNLPLIVTHSTAEMLEHLPNKAKTWHDLCRALRLANT